MALSPSRESPCIRTCPTQSTVTPPLTQQTSTSTQDTGPLGAYARPRERRTRHTHKRTLRALAHVPATLMRAQQHGQGPLFTPHGIVHQTRLSRHTPDVYCVRADGEHPTAAVVRAHSAVSLRGAAPTRDRTGHNHTLGLLLSALRAPYPISQARCQHTLTRPRPVQPMRRARVWELWRCPRQNRRVVEGGFYSPCGGKVPQPYFAGPW